MKVATVVGARPQLVKAAAVSRVMRRYHTEVLIHTGQHYDPAMSDVFFEELQIAPPEFNLGVGSGHHGEQTGAMLAGIEAILLRERPDWLMVYGDTNSTLAGAVAASKLQIPIAHVEAGLRSFNRRMPEEINRVVADQLSSLLLCPSQTAVDNLAAEGIHAGVHVVGDVMFDALRAARDRAKSCSRILDRVGVTPGGYVVATIHRAENTDDPSRLSAILGALAESALPVLFPVHPRTRKQMAYLPTMPQRVTFLEPLGYLDMVRLVTAARMVVTDSGGLQKEAYWLGVPCVTVREETEWVETVNAGWNILVGADRERIVDALATFSPAVHRPELYGSAGAAERCVRLLEPTGVFA